MALTVAQCRTAFADLVDASKFLPFLNQASERLMQSGLWGGLFAIVDFDSSEGSIALPWQYESVLGCTIRRVPRPIFGGFHEFLESGPGFLEDGEMGVWNMLVDEGQWPTQVGQITPQLIRLTISNALDAAKVVRVFGYNDDGPIYDSTGVPGISLTLANPIVTSSVEMIVTAVNKVATLGTVTLSSVDGATVTPLSVYQPPETNPQYRRYKTGTIQASDNGYPVIRAKCKRRFIPYVNESDQVYPSNLGALKFGVMAMNFEQSAAASEVAAAETFWGKAEQLLNQQLRHQRGGAHFPIDIPQDGQSINSW